MFGFPPAALLTAFGLSVVYCSPVNEIQCSDCCTYSDFSKWKESSFRPVPKNQCASGYVVVEQRIKRVLSGNCSNQTEEKTAECAPEQSLRLALLLDLGGSGQNTKSLGLSSDVGSGRFSRSANWDDEDFKWGRHVQICPSRGRRQDDVEEFKDGHEEPAHHSYPEPEPLENDPVEFDIHKHGDRYRRCTAHCEVQHVLFLLDTSGSVGRGDFKRLTAALGDLVPLFCKSIEIAAMTFSNTHFLEFCFNEFDNDCSGRFAARMAIRSIPYRGGYTHTAEALQCAFDNILTQSCGITPDAECVSIVFFTDGMSNGQGNVCNVVQTLKQQRKFESYSIGIGSSTNQEELRCLASDADDTHLFQFPSFGQFVNELGMIESVFAKTRFTCVNHPDSKPSESYGFSSECSKTIEDNFESGDWSSGMSS